MAEDIMDTLFKKPAPEPVTEPVANPNPPKGDQSRVPGAVAGDDIMDTLFTTPSEPAVAPKAPGELPAGPNPPRPEPEGEASHPLFGEEPGAPRSGAGFIFGGEMGDAFWRNVIEQTPIIGGPATKGGTDMAVRRRIALTGLPESGARKLVESEMAATDREYPGSAAAGKFVGSVGGLAVAAAKLPKFFGLASQSYKLPALIGGATNAVITGLDDWIRTGEVDPVKTGLSAVAGAGASALATSLNRVFSSAIKPGIEDLFKKAIVDHDIPLQAGKLSDNPVWGKPEGELLAAGEKLLPLVGRAQKATAREIDRWHRAITRTIGSDATRLTAKVLDDTTKRIASRMQVLKQLPPGTRWASDEMATLAERAKTVNILQKVMKVDRYGRFTPKQFHDVIRETLDAPGAPYASSALSDLADIGGIFLNTAPRAKLDLGTAWRLLKQGLATGAPAAAHHVYTHGLMGVPSLMTGIIGGVTGAAKLGTTLLGTQVAGAVARSPRVANVLIGQSLPWAPAFVKAGVGLAKPIIPGLVQHAVPEGRPLIHKLMSGQ